MVYTEVKEKNGKKYYYRVKSVRTGKRVSKKRKYLGVNLSKKALSEKEKEADKDLVERKFTRNRELEKIREKIKGILKKNGVKRAGIFGSYIRGEQKENSDIDILVDVPKNVSLLGFAGIKVDLEEALGKKIDLVEYNLIKQRIKDRILKEEIRII